MGPLVPVYVPEIVPQQAVSASWILHWGGHVVLVLTFPIFLELVGLGYIFMFYLSVITVGEYVIYRFAVDTTNRTDSQIDKMYQRY